MAKKAAKKTVATLKHEEASRTNIPTAELETLMREEERSPVQLAYARRNRDLDPQLVWRGKDEQDWSDLVVHAPPLYIQEKVHPKVLVDDLLRECRERADAEVPDMPDVAAGAFPIAFGNWQRAYTILDRVVLSVLRDPFTQAISGNVRFIARRRVGGQVVLAEAIRKLKVAT